MAQNRLPPPAYICDLELVAANVPVCLRERLQWVCWVWRWNGKKWTKVPINARTGAEGDSTSPETWSSFAEAAVGLTRWRGIAGVGFVFSTDDPFCGVDLDDCIDPSTLVIAPWAREIVRPLNCYCEISPSGTGVKLFLRGSKPGLRCRTAYADGEVEMYDHHRFFTTTGRRIVRCVDDGRIETG